MKSKIGVYESAEDLVEALDKPVATLTGALMAVKGDYTEKVRLVDVLRDNASMRMALDIALN